MNNINWLLRAVRWVRNPPSARMVRLVVLIIIAGLAMLALERGGLWPDWATLDHGRGAPRLPR